MKFYFNRWTDEARDACDKAGIPWRRVPTGGVDIYTENFDLYEDDYRERDIDPLDPDRKRAYRYQGVRLWKHPGTKDYYYLINGIVFFKHDRVEEIPGRSPSGDTYLTKNVVAIFDVVPPEEQGRYYDILMNRPAASDWEHGGRLM